MVLVFHQQGDWKCSGGCRRMRGCSLYVSVHCLWVTSGTSLFKKPKTSFSLSSRFSQKLETTKKKKKKKSMFQLCTPRLRCLCSVSLQAAAFEPHLGSSSGPHVGKLYPGDYNLQPEGRASQYVTGHFCTSGFFGGGSGSMQGPSAYQQKQGHTSSLVPSLKTFGICPLPESLQTRIIQQNNHYCLCCLFACLFVLENLHLLHTGHESRNWRLKAGSRIEWKNG